MLARESHHSHGPSMHVPNCCQMTCMIATEARLDGHGCVHQLCVVCWQCVGWHSGGFVCATTTSLLQ
eukprot:COSAG02_NODE_48341_length_334_cov_0.885106_1_plen_66_part_10